MDIYEDISGKFPGSFREVSDERCVTMYLKKIKKIKLNFLMKEGFCELNLIN